MNPPDLSRRDFLRLGAAGAAVSSLIAPTARAAGAIPDAGKIPLLRPYITPDDQFIDVSRGNPMPHALPLAALAEAGLTADTWRLQITADPFVEYPHTKIPATLSAPRTLADGTAFDLPALIELGRRHEVHFFKAMQCLNIEAPLGQGVWTGVPLRAVLRQCGKMQNVRRVYYWGFHYHDPKQIYKASLSYTQAMETAPGALPAFLAYKLNGRPISPERGGPVRLVVPWSHGYKSLKWLQHIFVTSDARNWDTYAEANNDPDSFLKTAAYVDKGPEKVPAGEPVYLTGQVVSGLSGVRHVEYWVRHVESETGRLADDDPELLRGPWTPCELQPQPDWARIMPAGLKPKQLLGFDRTTGRPLNWPLPYSITQYFAVIRGLKPGRYEIRARAVDLNDIAQPEPRPTQKTGRNGIQVRRLEIV
ncbi:MAG: molybdopterin-dependent oxidoreductase [Verrucomicrobia bacterium]|nr:molybdopterin-dependent oxidoreductase [Verrucomicrobiota bacterium]